MLKFLKDFGWFLIEEMIIFICRVVVSVLTFYSDDPSSNLVKVYISSVVLLREVLGGSLLVRNVVVDVVAPRLHRGHVQVD